MNVTRYLYTTVVALDANFRLRRRAVSNKVRNPALGSGWGYFVEDKQYRDYLKERVDNDEVCALLLFLPWYFKFYLDQYLHGVCGPHDGKQQIHQRLCNIRCHPGN